MRFAFLLVFLYGVQAHAGILLEPYVNYSVGKWTEGSSSATTQGVDLGGRVGITNFLGIMAGVDYMTGAWSDDSNPHNAIVPTDIGVFVGYDFPILLRAYAEYDFISKMNFTAQGRTNNLGGDGFKLGVGYKFFPFLSFNLEYKMATMTHDSLGGMGGQNLKINLFQIGISAPFDL